MLAFVVMPFDKKPVKVRGKDKKYHKQEIDFDAIYSHLIERVLVNAGYRVIRADHEKASGDIRDDMFQRLLLADLVVADLSIDNPNVWYGLGIRHALRARGSSTSSAGRRGIASPSTCIPTGWWPITSTRPSGPIRSS